MPVKHRKIALMGYRSVGQFPLPSSTCCFSLTLFTTGKSTLTAQYVEGRTIDFYDPTIENSESCEDVTTGDWFSSSPSSHEKG